MAATFYEPAYQRLRQWHRGQSVDLLCFVHATNPSVKELVEGCGAKLSEHFRAKCFAEIWEVPHSQLLAGNYKSEPSELDLRISQAMGCLGGRYSAAAGYLAWGDTKEGSDRRHFTSRLVEETVRRRGRGR